MPIFSDGGFGNVSTHEKRHKVVETSDIVIALSRGGKITILKDRFWNIPNYKNNITLTKEEFIDLLIQLFINIFYEKSIPLFLDMFRDNLKEDFLKTVLLYETKKF